MEIKIMLLVSRMIEKKKTQQLLSPYPTSLNAQTLRKMEMSTEREKGFSVGVLKRNVEEKQPGITYLIIFP